MSVPVKRASLAELLEDYFIGVELDDCLGPDRRKCIGGNSDRLCFQDLGADIDCAGDRSFLGNHSSRLRIRHDGGCGCHRYLSCRLPARLLRGGLLAARAGGLSP